MSARDLHGEQAIRLGRAFQQAWATQAPQSIKWNWEQAAYLLSVCKQKSKPRIVGESIVYDWRKSSTHWVLADGYASVTMFDKRAVAGCVSTGRDEYQKPWLMVRIGNWRSLSSEQVWRYDRAITSLSCGDWRCFYKMPPLNVLSRILGPHVPETEVRLWYVMAGNTPTLSLDSAVVVQSEQQAAVDAAKDLLRKFERAGGFEKWHLTIVK